MSTPQPSATESWGPWLLLQARRAFASNLQTIPIASSEKARLEGQGIDDTTTQRFFVWRRSLYLMVIVFTILTALLDSLNSLLDSGDNGESSPGLMEMLGGAADDDGDEPEEPKKETRAPASTEEGETRFARIAEFVQMAVLYAMPLAASLAFLNWHRLKRSRGMMFGGWLIAFVIPVALTLTPWSWWYHETPLPATATAEEKLARQTERLAEGVQYGAYYFVLLLPPVLSLLPGVQRACLRVKTLLPGAILPGWFLVSAAPYYSLLLLVTFVGLNQLVANLLLMTGMFLWLAAPLVYSLSSRTFTRPLVTPEDFQAYRRVQRIVLGMVALAGILLVAFVLTTKVLDKRLIGWSDQTSYVRPWDVLQFALEFFGRSLYVTALVADYLLHMSLSAWRNTKQFEETAQAGSHDQTMSQLERSMS